MNQFDSFLQRTANFISILFNPLIIPTLGTILVFRSGGLFSLWPLGIVTWTVLIVSLGTLWLPLVILQLLKCMQFIPDLQLENLEDRRIPYTLVLVPYIITCYYLRQLPVPEAVSNMVISATVALGVNIIFLFFWKISSHAIGVGGLVALVLVLFLRWHATHFTILYLAIFIAGLVCWARLWLMVHTVSQVYAGFATGFLITFLILIA